MKCFVTGGAGFIGSHLVDRLLLEGNQVVVYDNLSLGRLEFLKEHVNNSNFKFVKADLLNEKDLNRSMSGSDIVFHVAANSDIVKSALETKIDLEQGTIATYKVLEAMRLNAINKIVFTSSNVVYGEVDKLPIKEDYGPLFPISMYGASKLASEALISAYCHNFDFKAWIYRFANVTGSRVTHGVVLDFYNKLKLNDKVLEVLGNGKQAKPYIEVTDVVDGILYGFEHSKDNLNYFNLGTDGLTAVEEIAKEVLKCLGLNNTEIIYKGGVRGWPGDVPRVSLDMTKLKELGWKAKYSKSDDACKYGISQIIRFLKKTDDYAHKNSK